MKTLLWKHSYWLICAVAILCVTAYWSLWATDRYVSKATIVLKSAQGTSITSLSITSLLTGASSHELLVLREYLLSTDMLQKLDAALDLRSHYASEDIDFFSRLESPHVPIGQFHEYYLEHVSIELDEYAGVLHIKAQAFDPKTAHAIVAMLLREGEQYMNKMSQRIATQQIQFIKAQVAELKERLIKARSALLEYQNSHGLISPTAAVETLSTVVATLQGELAKLKARKRALSATQTANSPVMQKLERTIEAMRSQIEELRARMASKSGVALNLQTAQYQTLKMKLEFAKKMYTNALAVLQSTRAQAATSLQQVAALQSPTMPEYSTAPKRLHNIVVFAILAILAALIVHLLAAIVRDHRD